MLEVGMKIRRWSTEEPSLCDRSFRAGVLMYLEWGHVAGGTHAFMLFFMLCISHDLCIELVFGECWMCDHVW